MPNIASEYGKPDAPLGSYAALLATYGTLLFGAARLRRRHRRDRPSLFDLTLYAIATHKIARTLTRDQVTAPLRAPFVRLEGDAGRGEVVERARGHGLRRAVGQLITCPYCTGPWVAAGLLGADALAPRVARLVGSVFTIVTAADFLHRQYTRRQKGEPRMIKDVMTRDVKVVRPDDSIQVAAQRMAEEDVGFIPVCDGERLVGVITDRDLAVRAVAQAVDAANTAVRDLMTEEVTWCFDDEDVSHTAELMKRHDIRRVIVVDRNKRLVGVVALGDLARGQPGHSEEVLQDVSDAPPQK
ncbi:MAG TPA: DUF1360 domain-containing protein [Polyangia bacterium]|jgi:CBS domain-containing protein